jgi:hypothetical protein
MGLRVGSVAELCIGGPVMVIAELDLGSALVYYFDNAGVLHDHRIHSDVLREVPGPTNEPESTFGIPEALMKAKDDEAQRLRDAVDAQWADDQVRYAHTSGYVQDEAPSAGVTRQSDG